MGSRNSRTSAVVTVVTGTLVALAAGVPAGSTSAAATAAAATSTAATSTAASSTAATSAFRLAWVGSRKAAAPCSGATTLTCHTWKAKVTAVDDGDTVRVDLDGDGTTATEKVRLTGIQAMEQYTYSKDPKRRSGECHALAATARLEALLKPVAGRVRLQARKVASASQGRPLRTLQIRRDGAWVDLGTQLVREGHALWQHQPVEHTRDRANSLAEARARSGRKHLWDHDSCGAGPSSTARLRVVPNWDADGDDTKNVNGEYVRVVNDGASDVSLGGWWLRDSALRGSHGRGYTFPRGTVVKARSHIVLHAGRGTTTARTFHWGLSTPPFDNPGDPGTATQYVGDGAYLFDPQGDLRAAATWPCRAACADPLQGKVVISSVVSTGYAESVRLTNTTDGTLAVGGYVISSYPDVYQLGQSVRLGPHASLTLLVNGSPSADAGSVLHWGRPAGTTILNNAGDRVILRNASTTRLSCRAWGSVHC